MLVLFFFAVIILLLVGCVLGKQCFLLVNFCHQQYACCLVNRRWFIGLWETCSGIARLFALQVEQACVWVFESWWEKPGSLGLFHEGFVTVSPS